MTDKAAAICSFFSIRIEQLYDLLKQNAGQIKSDCLRAEAESSNFAEVIDMLADRIEIIREMNPSQEIVLVEMVRKCLKDWAKQKDIEELRELYLKLMESQGKQPIERYRLASTKTGHTVYRRLRVIRDHNICIGNRYRNRETGFAYRLINISATCLIKLKGKRGQISPDELLKLFDPVPDDQ